MNFLFSGQYQRSVSDIKEDAAVSEGAEHGELDLKNIKQKKNCLT